MAEKNSVLRSECSTVAVKTVGQQRHYGQILNFFRSFPLVSAISGSAVVSLCRDELERLFIWTPGPENRIHPLENFTYLRATHPRVASAIRAT